MKTRIKVLSAFLAIVAFAPVVTSANELTDRSRAAMPLCNCDDPANREICSRIAMSGAMQVDPNHRGNAQHQQGRAPAAFGSQRQLTPGMQ